jgi:hypothetical protein
MLLRKTGNRLGPLWDRTEYRLFCTPARSGDRHFWELLLLIPDALLLGLCVRLLGDKGCLVIPGGKTGPLTVDNSGGGTSDGFQVDDNEDDEDDEDEDDKVVVDVGLAVVRGRGGGGVTDGPPIRRNGTGGVAFVEVGGRGSEGGVGRGVMGMVVGVVGRSKGAGGGTGALRIAG